MDRLSSFQLEEILSTNTLSKSIHFLGTIDGEQAIVSINRTMPEPNMNVGDVHILENNGIYSWGLANWKHELPNDASVKIDVIWPATETHIAKYREQPTRTVVETPAVYTSLVRPFIDTMRGSRLDWVTNILHNGAEADQVIFKKDGEFLLLPNQRWDRKTMQQLYLMVLFYDPKLASIRDLTAEHVPMLQEIKREILDVCRTKYGLQPHELKLYFHYHPSYYQMHIHVANVALQQLDFGRSILVDNVIGMLEHAPMEKYTLSYILGEGHKLASIFRENNI